MIDQRENWYRMVGPVINDEEGSIYGYDQDGILMMDSRTFTRSDGTIISRLYERLTKASRRRVHTMLDGWTNAGQEDAYRQGVYDAYKALQEELKFGG
jgi:hypothetical protein